MCDIRSAYTLPESHDKSYFMYLLPWYLANVSGQGVSDAPASQTAQPHLTRPINSHIRANRSALTEA